MQISEGRIICQICNKEFSKQGLKYHLTHTHKIEAEDYYKKYLLKNNENICEMYGKVESCKQYTTFVSLNEGYRKHCSTKCMANNDIIKKKREHTCLEKYGGSNPFKSDIVKEKARQTFLKKYGVDHHLQTKQSQDKIKKTNLEKYGVENVSQLESIKKKKQDTCFKNFGVKNPPQSDIVMDKQKNTMLQKYGVENAANIPGILDKKIQTSLKKYGTEFPAQCDIVKQKTLNTYNKNFYPKLIKMLEYFDVELIGKYKNCDEIHEWKCKKCDTVFKATWKNMINKSYKWRCPTCFTYIHTYSKPEKEVVDFIKEILPNDKIIENDKSIVKSTRSNQKLELDVYTPEKKIAIEFDGLYWHSEERQPDKNYHLYKTEECEKQDIQLIHIFEDEWMFKQNVVKNRLKQIIGVNKTDRIHARKCIIKEIEPKIKNKFLDKYHIQGKDSSTIKLGAFYEDKLVSVMTFGLGNISKGSKAIKGIWELNRFCSNSNYHIPGIASKLLTHFKRNYNWKEIFSYADRRWSQGKLYYKLGFKLDRVNPPNYWYTYGCERFHRYRFRKRPDEPKDIPEWVLRKAEGYIRIWDCGTLKFILKNN